jgi:sugar phosphate isomerase/epimerase
MNPLHCSPLSRREFLKSSALGAATTVIGLNPAAGAVPVVAKQIAVGLQLYTVRAECRADFAGTLEQVAKLGYQGVEFAGYEGKSAREIRKMLDDHGLIICGTHTSYADLQPGKIDATIEFNRIIGNKFVICPSMTGTTREHWLDKAKEFNALTDKLKIHGMCIGYHAHAHDFQKLEDHIPWDIFFGNTRPEVIMQLDTGNCRAGGADPVAVLNKYPGRVRTIHIKPHGGGPDAVIGEDKIDWPAVFEFCETRGNTEWYVVEHETSKPAMETARRMFEAMKRFGKV